MPALRMVFALSALSLLCGAHPHAAPGVTSLTNRNVKYTVPERHYFVLERGPVRAVVVDNEAVDEPGVLEGHRAGYNGLASLSHKIRKENLFVSPYAGLNYEHIHDGTSKVDKERFEPRRSPIQLRVIDERTVELYQAPTPNWQLESCGRYQILADGTIEYTFECIPRAETFSQGYLAFFWASYIDSPVDKAIHFRGWKEGQRIEKKVDWIRAVTPEHGIESTHPPEGPLPRLNIDESFSLTLVNHPSKYVYTEPWYFGVSHDLAFVQMFRARDKIWLAQSPTGGGKTNPAWDFQWFVPEYKVDEAYGFVMRAAYLPYESVEQIEKATRGHRLELNADGVEE